MFRRLLTTAAIPGWLVFGWTMAGHVSTARVVIDGLQATTRFLDHHTWAGLLLSAALLYVAVEWPSLKKRMPLWLRIPKTSAERLDSIERKEIPALSKTVENVQQGNENAHRRVDEHRIWISGIERSLCAALKEMPDLARFVSEISVLLSQADEMIYLVSRIRECLAESEAAKAPFSKRWSDPAIAPGTDPQIIEWALLVERHVAACKAFANNFDVDEATVLSRVLSLLASTWNQPNSMQDAISILGDQKRKLVAVRDDYVVKFSARIAEVASEIIPR